MEDVEHNFHILLMLTLETFKTRFNALFGGSSTYAVADIYSRLSLTPQELSEETLRRFLRGRGNVSEKTAACLEEKLANVETLRTSRDRARPVGYATKLLLEPIFQASLRSVTSEGSAELRIIDQLHQAKTLVRFVDDLESATVERLGAVFWSSEDYLRMNPNETVLLLTNLETLPEEFVTHSNDKITISLVRSLLRNVFDLQRAENTLIEAARTNGTDILDLYPLDLKFEGAPATEATQAITKLVSRPEGCSLAVVSRFGSGKTTVSYRSALELVRAAVQRETVFPLPVVLSAARLPADLNSMTDYIAAEIRNLYHVNLSTSQTEAFVRQGKIACFVDAIDEVPAHAYLPNLNIFLSSLRGLGAASSNYVISMRGEMFATVELQDQCLGRRNLQVATLNPITIEKAFAILDTRVGPKATEVFNNLIGNEYLKDLLVSPLFLKIIIKIAQDGLTDVLSLRASTGPFEQFALCSILIEKYFQKWAAREGTRVLPKQYHLGDRLREEFCQEMAKRLWMRGESHDEGSEGVGIDMLYSVVYQKYRHELKIGDFEKYVDLFLSDAKLSMLLVRRENLFHFAHSAFQSFFLASAIVLQIDKRDFSSLAARPIPPAQDILFVLVIGRIAQDHGDPVRYIESLINDIRGQSHSPHVAGNLVKLLLRAFQIVKKPGSIDLTGLTLQGLDLSHLQWALKLPTGQTKISLNPGNSNMEFSTGSVRPPVNILASHRSYSANFDPAAYSFAARAKKLRQLRAYCVSAGILSADGKDAQGVEWVVIPGGKYFVPSYCGEKRDSDDNGNFILTPVNVTSFMVMKYPVTNWQYFQFVNVKEFNAFRSDVHSGTINNDYYLRSWTQIKKQFGDRPESSWNPKEIDPNWRNRPLVTVDHIAAEMFAAHMGASLPTELEMEIVSRAFLDDRQFVSGHDYPWDEDTNDGFAIYATDNENDIERWPTWSVDLSGKNLSHHNVSEFTNFVNSKEITAQLRDFIPYILVDGVREWTRDSYAEEWQPPRQCEARPAVCAIPLSMEEAQERGQDQARNYTVRGGSFTLAASCARISYRKPQAAKHCNDDCGFRCVKPIVPSQQ